MTVADARAALTGAHLQTVQRGRYDETAPVGEVVDQDPVSGIRLQEGETVTIFVSRGPRPITLDTYAGQPAATVEAALRNLGLVPRRTEVYATTVGAGDVVRTDPIAGTVVHRGDGVTVVVSLGPRTFPMPDVVGQTKDQAVAFLTSLGLDPQTRQLPGSAGDLVVGQIPIKEAIVQQGQQVTLYIGG
jgi:serine/threonine-protein kinase